MASLGVSKGLLLMKGGGEDDIAKLIAERKKNKAAPDSAKLAKEKDMADIYNNKSRLDSMVNANQKQWSKHVMSMDATSKIIRKN